MKKILLTISLALAFFVGGIFSINTVFGQSSITNPTLWKIGSGILSPISSSWKVNTSTITGVFSPANGGTGTSTAPSEGDLLIGNSGGTYDFVSSSSLPFVATETDPIFTASQAFNITSGDITNLGNLSGTNTGDQDLSGYLLKSGGTMTGDINFDGNDALNLGVLNLNSTALGTPAIGNFEFYNDDLFFNITTPVDGSQYPPAQSDTYVKATTFFSAPYYPYNATDPTKSLTGSLTNGWVGGSGQTTNQAFHIDLGTKKTITQLYYENGHQVGGLTTAGAKNFTIWGSNTASAFADTTYGTDTNWTQLTTNVSQFDQHVGADTADPKYVTITNTIPYRYYRIKIADNWGYGSYMMVRRFELQADNDYRKNVVLTDGGTLNPTYVPYATTNGRLADSGMYWDTANSRLGIGTDSPAYTLDINNSAKIAETVYLGEGLSTSGLQPLIRGYVASAYRTLMGVNGTTGKLVYYAPGGTQGLEILNYNREVKIDHDQQTGYGVTASVTDPNSAGQHHLTLNTYFNGTGTYNQYQQILTDNASNADSNYYALYSAATYGGTPTLEWRIRKDLKLFGQASQWDVDSAQQYGNQLNHTWNDSGTTYTGLDVNITNTDSNAASKVFNFNDQFSMLASSGNITGSGNLLMNGDIEAGNDLTVNGAFILFGNLNVEGGLSTSVISKSSSYTVFSDYVSMFVDTNSGDVTATLSASPTDGRVHIFTVTDVSNNLIIDGNGNNIVDSAGSAATKTISTLSTYAIQYDGSVWRRWEF